MRKILIYNLLTLLLTLSACSVYRIDINQGNILETEQIEKLKIGMNEQQVIFVMGTPLLKDPFHPNRWDYISAEKKPGKPVVQQRLTLYFADGKLSQIDKSELEAKVIQ